MRPRKTVKKPETLECLIDGCQKEATEDLGPLPGKWLCEYHENVEDVQEKIEKAEKEMNVCKTC